MRTRLLVVLIFLMAAPLAWAAEQGATDKFHLKPGAKGKICLGCHTQFEETMKRPFLHAPVKQGDCSDCHSPHASSHGKLLEADPDKICGTCHSDLVPSGSKSSHPDAAGGRCTKCHDPHGSANEHLLIAAGNELCFTCHKEIAKSVSEAKYKHPPVLKSCLTCHGPHSEKDAAALLTKAPPELCTGCHKTDQPAFQKAHMGYPVGKSDCTSCHDPHGSSRPKILWASVHPPVANRNCGQCHYEAGSPDALKVKKQGLELCQGCHGELYNQTFGLNRIHWPVVDRKACLNCHRPHASKVGKLLIDPELKLCGRCHADIVRHVGSAAIPHQPVADGNCTMCHAPHGSNTLHLLAAVDSVALCGTCHDWSNHTSHPIGANVVDPRNKNARLECVSCHDVHGSAYKYLTWQDKKMDLCVTCHQDFRR